MNAKKVWGIILIIVGVLFILGGASKYYDTLVIEKSLSTLDQMTNQMIGKSNADLFGLNKYVAANQRMTSELFNDLKIRYVLFILLGIFCSINGTFLLNNASPLKTKHPTDDYSNGYTETTPSVFCEDTETNEPKDDSKWMPSTINPKASVEIKTNVKTASVFNLKTGKDESEDDNPRWMHPDMRNPKED